MRTTSFYAKRKQQNVACVCARAFSKSFLLWNNMLTWALNVFFFLWKYRNTVRKVLCTSLSPSTRNHCANFFCSTMQRPNTHLTPKQYRWHEKNPHTHGLCAEFIITIFSTYATQWRRSILKEAKNSVNWMQNLRLHGFDSAHISVCVDIVPMRRVEKMLAAMLRGLDAATWDSSYQHHLANS